MTDISEERRGQIALMLVKMMINEKPAPAPKDLRRSLGQVAKKIGIKTTELIDFAKPLYEEAFNHGFDPHIVI